MAQHPRRVRLDTGTAGLVICFSASFFVLGVLTTPSLPAQESQHPDQLTYIKVMKGSFPEYQAITVDVTGVGTYEGRKLNESSRPRPLKLSAATTRVMFELAHAMGDFRSVQLEGHLKVANLGMKTFIYEHKGQKNKVEFNYTQNRRAQDLMNLFEGIGSVEQHIGVLEFSAKYDRLGLPGELRQIEIDINNKALVDPELMVPILQKIANDSQLLHIAQMRAANILHLIQNPR